jgi:hypothetical protein
MGYKNTIKLLELELKALREEVHTLRKTVNILENEHKVETKYGGYILSSFHKSVVPKVKTSKGEVEYADLVKFVVDKKPLEFKENDKELITEVHPDGTEIKKVVDKEKKTKYVAPYKTEDTISWLVEMQRAMKMAGV